MATPRTRVYTTEQVKDPLSPFIQAVQRTNPFASDIHKLDSLNASEPDVTEIHGKAFRQIERLAEQATRENRGTGVVLWGQPGIGKSHFLSRVSRWAAEGRAWLVPFYNLQVSPDELPRYVLKSLISSLTEDRIDGFAETPLFKMLHRTVKEALQHSKAGTLTVEKAKLAYKGVVDRLLAQSRPDLRRREIYDVLFLFYWSSHATFKIRNERQALIAVRWLSGDPIDPEDAKLLNVLTGGDPEQPVELGDDQQLKQVLVALTNLYLNLEQPILLCFDQVDTLEPEMVGKLARFLHSMIDSCGNILVITSGVQQSLNEFVKQMIIHHASWDRIAEEKIQLQMIDKEAGRLILERRLERHLKPYEGLQEVARLIAMDKLFPLGTPWLDGRLKDLSELRPRDIIRWAKERWREQQELLETQGAERWLREWGPTSSGPQPPKAPREFRPLEAIIDEEVGRKLEDHKEGRMKARQSLPPSADHLANLLQHVLNDMQPGLVEPPRPVRAAQKRSHDFLIRREGQAPIKVLCLVTDSGRTATPKLSRMAEDVHQGEVQVLLTDARMPLPKGDKGKEHLDTLKRRGPNWFRHVELPFEHYAALDALKGVVVTASSGDIEIEEADGRSRRVIPEEVIQSHRRKGRYLALPLLSAILAPPAKEAPPEDPMIQTLPSELATQVLKTFIVGELVLYPGLYSRELAEKLRAKHQGLDVALAQARLEEVAKELQKENQILVTPSGEGLMLRRVPRKRSR